jgi:hypothetical protein
LGVDAIGDDVAKGCGRRRDGGRIPLEGEGLEKKDGEVVDVAGAGAIAFVGVFSVRGFADAVAAELDGLADGEDMHGLDVFVDEAEGVERLEGADEAGGELMGFCDGEATLAKDLAQIGVRGFHDGVDEGGVVEGDGAEMGQGE